MLIIVSLTKTVATNCFIAKFVQLPFKGDKNLSVLFLEFSITCKIMVLKMPVV